MLLAFPGFLLALSLVAILGVVLKNTVISIGICMGTAILFAAGLGFLGIGIQPPTPEWGSMLGSARAYMMAKPHVAVCTKAAES